MYRIQLKSYVPKPTPATTDDVMLIGHDDPHNIAIAQGKPRLRKFSKISGIELIEIKS